MRRIILGLLVLLPYLVSAQGHGRPQVEMLLKGTVIDSVSEKPVEYASIAVFSIRDSALVGGGISDVNGYFEIKLKRPGRFYITIDFIGFKQLIISPVEMRPDQGPEKNLGRVIIIPSAQTLDGVEIVAEKPLVELSIDKKVVNVEQNLTTAGGTALEVLENVPGVEVDQDGNVSLRGSGNVTILIDGRPSTLAGADSKSVLEQIPAETIESVELITNPSAKYRPDGMVGIINIILKKKKGTGLNTLVSLSFGTWDRYSASISMNYSTDKFNIYGSYNYRDDKRPGRGESSFIYYNNNDYHFLNQDIETTRGHLGHSFKFGGDWYIAKKTSLGGSFGARLMGGQDTEDALSWYRDINDSIVEAYYNKAIEDEYRLNYDASISFQQKFKKPGQQLNIDGFYSYSDDVDSTFNRLNYLESDFETVISSDENDWYYAISPTLHDIYNLKIDYVHPFNDSTKLEAGFDGSWTRMDMKSEYLDYNFASQEYAFDSIRSNHFLFDENIQAIYLNYSTKIRKWGLSLGVRGEMASTNARQKDSTDNFRTYNSIYPTGALSYKLSKSKEIMVTYSRRINRPRARSLNPFIDYSFYPNMRTGNPYLDPEYINSFEITYAQYSKKGTFMPSLFYKQVFDVMTRYRISYGDTAFLMTWENYNSAISYGAELIYTYKFFPWWNASISGSWYRVEIDGSNVETDITGNSFGWNARLNNQFKFKNNWEAQFSGFIRGPRFTGQANLRPFYMFDAAVKKGFFNDKLEISLRARDLFNTGKFMIDFEDDTYEFHMKHQRSGTVLYLGLTWKLSGDYKEKRQRGNGSDGMDGGGDDIL